MLAIGGRLEDLGGIFPDRFAIVANGRPFFTLWAAGNVNQSLLTDRTVSQMGTRGVVLHGDTWKTRNDKK